MCARRRANLALMLDRNSRAPIHEQIYAAVSEAVRSGRIGAGEHLPSVRQLSADLMVSHTIVEQAYLELSVEGYISSKPRSGYVVEDIHTAYFEKAQDTPMDRAADLGGEIAASIGQGLFGEEEDGANVPYDFSYMRLHEGSFPMRSWERACTEVCLGSSDGLERYSYFGQRSLLQEQIARHLLQARGIECDPRQVMLEPASAAAVMDFLRLFDASSDVLGIEEPGWQVPRLLGSDMGFACVPLACDGDGEAFSRAIRGSSSKVAFLTPSHQFPTGKVLPLRQRVEVLEWAHERDAYIVEDDSCFEYRYDMRPIPSLFSLDKHCRTIYLGNVSKVLSPGLRLAYLVLPPQLLEAYLGRYPSGHTGVSAFDAAVLGQMMLAGDYDRHVGRMVQVNKRVHDRLLACLNDRFGDLLSITGKHSGMHLYVTVRNGMTTDELISSALAEGAKVYSTARYWFSRKAEEGIVMVGFSALRMDEVEPGVEALARAWLRGWGGRFVPPYIEHLI